MPTPFDGLQKASFADRAFPIYDCTVAIGLRDHVHEYPHAPGGAPEKLGRKLIEVRMTAPFMDGFRAYPLLFSEILAELRITIQQQSTQTLVIPTLGTIQAYPISWEEKTDARVRSGVVVSMTYREDQSTEFAVEELVKTGSESLATDLTNLNSDVNDSFTRAGLSPLALNLFDAVQSVGAQVLGYADQVESFGDLIVAKTEDLSNLCQQADKRLDILNQPIYFRVTESLHKVWASSNKLHADALKLAVPLVPFEVPGGLTMSAADISRAIYGDNSRAVELLKLNGFPNPFAVPGGTRVRAYANQAA